MLTYFLATFIAGLVKLTSKQHLKYLVLAWLGANILLILLFNRPAIFTAVLPILLIKAGLVYGWLLLLYKTEDTIFTYIIILILGVFLLNLF